MTTENKFKTKLGNFIIDHLGLGMFRYDMDRGVFQYVNESFSSMLAYKNSLDLKNSMAHNN